LLATIFVTKKWTDHNPAGMTTLQAHPELFDLEDHATAQALAVTGASKEVLWHRR
jgi:hypothetical protein